MSVHKWSEESRYFQGLCSEVLKPELHTGSSCFAYIIPKVKETEGTVQKVLGPIQVMSLGVVS